MISRKSIIHVIVEAHIVAFGLVALYWLINKFIKPLLEPLPALSPNRILEIIFLSGLLFHLLFEYSGANLAYSLDYCKMV